MKRLMVIASILAVGIASTGIAQSADDQTTAKKAEAKQTPTKKVEKKKDLISLADARGKIDEVIDDPSMMTEVMKKLSAEDQVQFLADVNSAISSLPASTEEKSAKYLNVNHAAMKGAASGNVSALLAETFATVSPEALTIICERFAVDLLNRDTGNPNETYTDAQYEKICVSVMEKVNERCEETDNGSSRAVFAIVMLLRASNGTIPSLTETLIETLKHEDAKEMARNEWIPTAMGLDGHTQSYESLLASADAGRRPDLEFVLVIAGPQFHDAVLMDIFGKNTDGLATMNVHSPVLDAVENPFLHQVPTVAGEIGGGANQADPKARENGDIPVDDPRRPNPNPTPPEPKPYQWQTRY